MSYGYAFWKVTVSCSSTIVWRIVVGLALLIAFVALRTGSNEVKAAVMATASIVGLYAFFRGFLSR